MAHKLLRTAAVASLMAAPVLTMMAESASADKANFWISNDSGLTISYMYLSEAGRATWDNDILGANVLPSGSSVQVYFGNPDPSVCFYDVQAIFEDGQVVEDYSINVCSNGGYSFY